MEKESPKTIFDPSELIKLKMMQVELDAVALVKSTIAEDKNFNEFDHKNHEGKYILSTQELTQYIADDLREGKGEGWRGFTKDYNEMLPEHQIYYKPCVDNIRDYINSEIGNYKIGNTQWGNFKPGVPKNNLMRAHQYLEEISAQNKVSEDDLGYWGGLATMTGALGTAIAGGAGAVAAGAVIGGVGAALTGYYGGKITGDIIAQDKIDRNEDYIREQKEIQRRLREKAERNKRLNRMMKNRRSVTV